ncbi:hypothetical protein BGZ65_012234, partial [Modicella reniformis]
MRPATAGTKSAHERDANISATRRDGMVITKLSRFELCAIEAAKKDAGKNDQGYARQ